MPRTRAALLPLVALLLLASASGHDGAAAEETAALAPPVVVPASVTLSRYEDAPIRVLVLLPDDGSPGRLSEAELSYAATPGLAVEVTPVETTAGQDKVWEVSLRAMVDAPDRGVVAFRFGAEGAPANPEAAVGAQVRRAQLEVTVEPARTASPLADTTLSIETRFASVDEFTPVSAVLTIQNTSRYPLRVEGVEITTPAFLEVAPVAATGVVGAYDTILVPFEMRLRRPPPAGEGLILARVLLARGEGALVQRGVAVVEHKIAVGGTGDADALAIEPLRDGSPLDDAELSIKVDFAGINELVPVTAYLLIKNTSVRPLRLEGLELNAPPFLKVEPSEQTADIAPHGTLIVPFKIEVEGRPQIGNWLILARVKLARGEGELEQHGIGVVEQTVEVGVPGVSEVLKLLELPSILLIPGALILATWSLLGAGNEEDKPPWLKWKTSSFWLVAVTLSILVFGGLTLLQRQFGVAANFLVAFGIRDAAWLWLGSVGVAATSFGLWRGLLATARSCTRRWRDPLPGDAPLTILKKLRRAQLPFYLPTHPHGAGGRQTIFALGFAAPDGETWVIPKMLLPSGGLPAELVTRINTANNRAQDGLGDLIEALSEGHGNLFRRAQRNLAWEAGEISRPTTVAASDLGAPTGSRSPLEFS